MQKQSKDLLRTVVVELRHTLIGWYDDGDQLRRGDLDRELERLGVGRDGGITPLDALPYVTAGERRAQRVAEAQLADVAADQRPAIRQEIVERAAYTWINRLLALRAMEARGLMDETLRPNPAYDGIPEALFIQRHTDPQRSSGADGGWWAVLEAACRAQAASLPGLFDLDDPNAALRPSTPALLKCVSLVGGPLPVRSDDFSRPTLDLVFRDPDAIGWAYQFYQEEAKARTYAKLGRGGKVETRREIAAVTQLFTEPYMVQWLLQNSLGRSYHELYPDSRLPATWAYYIRREGAAAETGRPGTEGPGARSLEELTFMDPCMGSGHFEREAFDMLAAMFREQHPEMDARAIADRILDQHLHGIDIDPRAAQLAALTLTLRAWELVADERRQRGLAGPGQYRPPRLNFATTPTHLTPGALERHLQRHPEDHPFEPVLRGVFEALEQAPILGSLLKPGEHLDQALATYRRPGAGVQMGLLDESASLNRLLEELARHDPGELKRVLLARISRSFAAEAGNADDVGAALFGREAGEGVRLLDLLDRDYAVVATNPPYLGSKHMETDLKQYVEAHYETGKRDLYAAFILKCLALCRQTGRLAMVTMQGWIFARSYASLRANTGDHQSANREEFSGLVTETCFDALTHLGRYAFSEIGNAVVAPVLFVLMYRDPMPHDTFVAFRLTTPRISEEQARLLRNSVERLNEGQLDAHTSVANQLSFLSVPDSPILYYLDRELLSLFEVNKRLHDVAEVRTGLGTGDNSRFTRCCWETGLDQRWLPYAKGGGYSKWAGLDWLSIDWQYDGSRLKAFPHSVLRAQEFYFAAGLTYSPMSGGALGVRYLRGALFDVKGSCIFMNNSEADMYQLASCLNSHTCSYFTRVMSRSLELHVGYLAQIPIPKTLTVCAYVGQVCVLLKTHLVASEQTERSFTELTHESETLSLSAILHTIEGFSEHQSCRAFELTASAIAIVLSDTGIPPGWHPLIAGHDALPDLPTDLDMPSLPDEVLDYLAAHERIHPDPTELARIKANLRTLYEAGPGAMTEDADLEDLEHQGDEDEAVSGAYIPIPTETFLEELSVKLQIHPISVYWLLEELRAEGVRCKPEEQRLLEDRLSVLVLRLLGHRWPRQLEAGEPVPPWADRDGIIPLTAGTGEATVADRLRQRLRAEDGPLGAQRVEAWLEELTGQPLETWLRKTFFERHTRQFKRRPIAWQLASTPVATGKTKAKQLPAFECLLYYHACGGDVLARIRTQYVEPLLIDARRRVEQARKAGDDTEAALATARIYELEDFAQRLRQVEESGFACAALDELLAGEPLDRWSGDGVFAPGSRDELLSDERAWRVDINDGVRVNVAPLQVAGLLAGDVLNKKDLSKAIADRARWRSDERRWVRAGKLPRCGWIDESIPESPAWAEIAPAREAERVRLEEKRKAVLGQTSA